MSMLSSSLLREKKKKEKKTYKYITNDSFFFYSARLINNILSFLAFFLLHLSVKGKKNKIFSLFFVAIRLH